MQNPLDQHWKAVKRILRYLKGTIHQGLILKASKYLNINAFSDADWASAQDDRKSTSGYCVYLDSNPISCCAKKQSTVSRYSMEAEFRSMENTTAEILWIKSLLSELRLESTKVPTIQCDNTSAISLSTNPILHSKTKHIEIDQYFIRDHVMKGKLRIGYIPSTFQKVDVLTKPLSRETFTRLKVKLNVDEADPSLRFDRSVYIPEQTLQSSQIDLRQCLEEPSITNLASSTVDSGKELKIAVKNFRGACVFLNRPCSPPKSTCASASKNLLQQISHHPLLIQARS